MQNELDIVRDVTNLVSTGFDRAHIERWTRELDLVNLWQACSHD